MKLTRNVLFCLTSILTLAWVSSCASKKEQATGGSGGSGFQANADAGDSFDPNTYCNGIFRGQVCQSTRREADLKTVNMLLVIDESNSMNSTASSATTLTKWQEMTQALSAALTNVGDSINFGLKLYPYSGADAGTTAPTGCSVPTEPNDVNVEIASGASNLLSIINTVGKQTPAGGTPTTLALTQALAYFKTGNGAKLQGQKFVLLATDGGPNCNSAITCTKEACTVNLDGQCANGIGTTVNCCDNGAGSNMSCLDDLAVVDAIGKLAAESIKTYVIGIPGAENYKATLNRMADAGQVPNLNGVNGEHYYAVSAGTSLADLTKAFEDITTKLVKSCDIALKRSPVDATLVQVAMDCKIVPYVNSADSGTSGFTIDYSQNPAHLVLTGSYCDNISTVGARNLDIIEGCVPPP